MARESIDYESFLTQILQRINSIEEKTKNNKNMLQLLSSNVISLKTDLRREVEKINRDLRSLKRDVERIKQNLDYVMEELPNLVRREEMKIIERFMKMWEPLKFVTKEDVERIIDKKIKS